MGDYTEIVVLLDRSGSMNDRKTDHEGGLNSFIEDQRQLEGNVRFTLIQFDDKDPCEIMHDGVALSEVGKYTLIPRGGTPLLDALGGSIAHVKTRLLGQKQIPDLVIFMVITDGRNNASKEFTKAQVKNLVDEQEKAGWKFLFLGANIDAFDEAGGLGIQDQTTLSFADVGTQSTYTSTSQNVRRARFASATGQSVQEVNRSLEYTEEQRKAALKGEEKK